MRRLQRCLVPICMPVVMAAASAADPEEGKTPVDWTLSGEARFRPEWRDNADLDGSADDDLRQGFMRIRLGVSVEVGETFRLFVQAQDARTAGEEASTASNERNLDLHQGYLDLKGLAGGSLLVRVGRQELKYGDERMIGAFGWDNVGRAFDGVRAIWSWRRSTLDGFAARVSSNMTGGATEGSDLYGVYFSAAPREGSAYEAYALSYADNVDAAGETGALDDTRVHAIGGRARDRLGPFDFVAEAVVERGEIQGDGLAAAAAAVRAGLSWGEDGRFKGFAGYDFATGDEDPNDGDRQEFFNFFPTNHLHYGYMDYEGWRNLRSPYAGASMKLGRHFAQARAHRFLLDEDRGPWKSAGGAILGFDPDGASGSSVGVEYDVTYLFTWREKTTIEAGLGRFEPGRFARRTRGDDPSHWAYLMLTWGF